METDKKVLINFSLKAGLVIGAIFGGISILAYLINENLMANMWFGIFSLVLLIVAAVIAALKLRTEVGGDISFGNAFMGIALIGFTSSVVNCIFSILLHHAIDPDLGGRLMEITIQNTEAMMRRFGAPEDQIGPALEKAREADSYGVGSLIMGGVVWGGIVGNAIISLILAAIVKRNRSEEEF